MYVKATEIQAAFPPHPIISLYTWRSDGMKNTLRELHSVKEQPSMIAAQKTAVQYQSQYALKYLETSYK
jgi:hypothetical protein